MTIELPDFGVHIRTKVRTEDGTGFFDVVGEVTRIFDSAIRITDDKGDPHFITVIDLEEQGFDVVPGPHERGGYL